MQGLRGGAGSSLTKLPRYARSSFATWPGIASRVATLETYTRSSLAALASRHDVLITRGSIPTDVPVNIKIPIWLQLVFLYLCAPSR
jgi:hypothetical protein